MGKGARTRIQNAGKNAELKAQKVVEAKKEKRNKSIAIITSITLVAVILLTTVVYTFYYANGKYLRDTVVATSDNYEVDNAMMTYFVKTSYVNMQSQYGEYFSLATGIDPTKSLKKQVYSAEEGTTWFDMMLTSAVSSVKGVLALCEEAKADGITLTDRELEYINAIVDSTDAYYLEDGVTKNDIQKAVELSFIAQKYSSLKSAEISYTDDEVLDYYVENINTYRTVDYRAYSINYSEDQGEDKVTYSQDQAKEKSEDLAAAKDEEAFTDLLSEIIKELNPDIVDEDLQTALDNTAKAGVGYVADNEFSTWAFDDARKSGETYVEFDEEKEIAYIYYLVTPAHRDETPTVDFRTILLDDALFDTTEDRTEKSQEVYDAYMANPTEENFIELVTANTGDANTMATGGLYEGINVSILDEDLADWICDESRVAGDVEMFPGDTSTSVMYFVSEGGQDWQEQIIQDMRNTAMSEKITEINEKYEVLFNNNKMTDIPL